MTLKNFATVNAYYERQMSTLRQASPARRDDENAIPTAAEERTLIRDRVTAAYAIVYDRTIKPGSEPRIELGAIPDTAPALSGEDAEMLHRLWALEDVPVLTLVASKPVTDPASPILAPDKDLDARVAALMAHWDDEDVPGPDEGDSPQTPSTEDPPTGAPGPGTQDDHDNALD